MTVSGFSNAFVGTMLSWLKGLANWVLRLFNLAGNAGTSPLLWLSNNWAKLLVLFLLLGIAMDLIVWLVRWRPYWVWFRKERVIVNDETFFAGGRIDHRRFNENDELADEDWQERDFVVASSVAKRKVRAPHSDARADEPAGASRRRSNETRVPARRPRTEHVRRTTKDTIIRRGEDKGGRAWDDVVVHHAEAEAEPQQADLFGYEGTQPGVTDSYEDEVFNVSSLPSSGDFAENAQPESLFGDEE